MIEKRFSGQISITHLIDVLYRRVLDYGKGL